MRRVAPVVLLMRVDCAARLTRIRLKGVGNLAQPLRDIRVRLVGGVLAEQLRHLVAEAFDQRGRVVDGDSGNETWRHGGGSRYTSCRDERYFQPPT